jgi:hypothetical protein
VFGAPNAYPPPIRSILIALNSGAPISDGRMEMFSLACAITAVQPTNGIKVKGAELLGVPVSKKREPQNVPAEDAGLDFGDWER